MQEYKILGDAYFSHHDTIFHLDGISIYDFDIAKFIAKSNCEEHTITLI